MLCHFIYVVKKHGANAMKISTLFGCILLFLGSCAMANINFTDAKKPILVKKNKPEFTIVIKSNRSTGYQWLLAEDSDLIVPVSQVYHRSDSKLMGAPGYEVWTFKVKPKGFTVPQILKLKLRYARIWNLHDGKELEFKVVTSA